MKDYFSGFKSKTPEYKELGAVTDHPVKLVRWEEIDSFFNFDGTEKDRLPEYKDPTPQLVLIFVSTNGGGSYVCRLQGQGYYKMHELSAKKIKAGDIFDVDGYACVKDKDGDFYRIENPKKTEACMDILSNLFNAFDLPIGSGISELNRAVEESRVMLLTTKAEEYEGKEHIKPSKFRKARVQV